MMTLCVFVVALTPKVRLAGLKHKVVYLSEADEGLRKRAIAVHKPACVSDDALDPVSCLT